MKKRRRPGPKPREVKVRLVPVALDEEAAMRVLAMLITDADIREYFWKMQNEIRIAPRCSGRGGTGESDSCRTGTQQPQDPFAD